MQIIQYWHSEHPPCEVAERINSVIHNNTERSHVLFNESTALNFIDRHFSARERDAFLNCAVHAMKCDYFRYCALLVMGGIYIDAYFLCLKNLAPLTNKPGDALLFQRTNKHIPNGFMVIRQPGNPLMRFALDIATLNIEQRVLTNVWAATGPGIITTLYELHRLGSRAAFLNSFPERPEWTHKSLTHLSDIIIENTHERISDLVSYAFLAPAEDFNLFLTVEPQPAYKRNHDHWANWCGSIYTPLACPVLSPS